MNSFNNLNNVKTTALKQSMVLSAMNNKTKETNGYIETFNAFRNNSRKIFKSLQATSNLRYFKLITITLVVSYFFWDKLLMTIYQSADWIEVDQLWNGFVQSFRGLRVDVEITFRRNLKRLSGQNFGHKFGSEQKLEIAAVPLLSLVEVQRSYLALLSWNLLENKTFKKFDFITGLSPVIFKLIIGVHILIRFFSCYWFKICQKF